MELGLLGGNLAHSLSPLIHERFIDACGLSGNYRLLEKKNCDLADFFEGLRSSSPEFRGLNVTIPHKEIVVEFLDQLDLKAASLGAVNTIIIETSASKTRLLGANTDIDGFGGAIEDFLLDCAIASNEQKTASFYLPEHITILGAGGAARAVVQSIISSISNLAGRASSAVKPLSLRMVCRPGESRNRYCRWLANHSALQRRCPSVSYLVVDPTESYIECDLLINATPVGQIDSYIPDWLLAMLERLSSRTIVYDLVYGTGGRGTPLTRAAEELGMRTRHGGGMLVRQAARSFELWTGKQIEQDLIDSLIEDLF